MDKPSLQFGVIVGMCSILVVLLASCGIGEKRVPERGFAPSELLIDGADMPPGWIHDYGPGPAIDDRATNDAAMIKFMADTHPQGRGISHSVYRYEYISVAKYRFGEKATLAGTTPEAWTFRSNTADEERFVCYDYEGREPYPVCRWVARYEEYVVVFRGWLLPERLTLQDMDRMVAIIDERMAQYLDR
jgi:hypothetical protein